MGDREYDILVIGGGVIGLAIARELNRNGVRKIAIIDQGVCGREASWAAGGMLGPQAEADEAGLFFDVCAESRDLFPLLAAELLDETGIDIELDRTGTIYLAFDDSDVKRLRRRYAWQWETGLDVEWLNAEEVRRREPFISPDVRGAVFFPNDWQVENRRLLLALQRYAELNGIDRIEETSVDRLVVEGHRVVGIGSGDRSISGELTIAATGAWTSLIKIGVADMPFRIEPVRGQMIMFKTAKRLFRHVVYSKGGYIIPRSDGRILVGSTTERVGFDRSTTMDAVEYLRNMACEIAPSTAGLSVNDHWSGLRPFAFDALPVIGPIEGLGGLVLATAHYRNGILLAPWTAKAVAEGLQNPSWLDDFSPDRFRLRTVGSAA